MNDNGRGRPRKPGESKVLRNGLWPRQWIRLKEEAAERGLLSAAQLLREAVDFYFDSLDKTREKNKIEKEENVSLE